MIFENQTSGYIIDRYALPLVQEEFADDKPEDWEENEEDDADEGEEGVAAGA